MEHGVTGGCPSAGAKRLESLGTFFAVAILRQKMDTFLENCTVGFSKVSKTTANQTQQRVHSISGIKQCHNHFIISGCFMHSSIMWRTSKMPWELGFRELCAEHPPFWSSVCSPRHLWPHIDLQRLRHLSLCPQACHLRKWMKTGSGLHIAVSNWRKMCFVISGRRPVAKMPRRALHVKGIELNDWLKASWSSPIFQQKATFFKVLHHEALLWLWLILNFLTLMWFSYVMANGCKTKVPMHLQTWQMLCDRLCLISDAKSCIIWVVNCR